MKHFIFFLLFIPLLLTAQSPLQGGFDLLEKGQFKAAAQFFENYIKKEGSTDKTALLCYGRAVGLSGDIAKSQTTFLDLLKTYPGDYEITLNYAESYLWGKQPAQALGIYKELVAKDSSNFVALLGLANTYAALKEYENASMTIEKALKQNSPNKQNAQVSKKFILLALADSKMKKRELKQAKDIVTPLLTLYPNDKDVLFLAATLELVGEKYAKAKSYYLQVIAADSMVATTAYLGIAYSEFMLKQSVKALKTSNKALAVAKDTTQVFQASIGKVNALGWNKKFKDAFQLLDTLAVKYPTKWEVASGVARLRVWNNQSKKAIPIYEQLLTKDSLQRDVIMGYLDALVANGLEKQAMRVIEKNQIIAPDFFDLQKVERKIQLSNSLQVKMQVFGSADNGNNTSQNLKMNAQLPSNGKFKPGIQVAIRKVTDSNLDKSSVTQIAVGGVYKFNSRLSANAFLGIFSTKTTLNTSTQPYLDLSLTQKIGKRQTLQLGVKQDMQTYNSSLVNLQLKTLDFRVSYATQSAKLLGFYTEDLWSKYSDGNTRILSFGSLYVNIKNEPTIKTGINGTYLSFNKQVSDQYFSPKRYMAVEAFAQFENMEMQSAKFLYQVFIAGGQQKIENANAQNMFRGTLKAGYRWADWGYCNAYYLRSNSSTTNVLGYGYNEFGIECKIHFLKGKK